MVQHQIVPVPARDLRRGDLLRVGSSTNYVLVADAHLGYDLRIAVTVYNGGQPNHEPTLYFDLDAPVELSGRDLAPKEPETAPNAAVDLMAALRASLDRTVRMVAPTGETVVVPSGRVQQRLNAGYRLKGDS